MLRAVREQNPRKCGQIDSVSGDKRKTLQTGLIALHGGLGNQLFELISLFGIAETLNRTAIVNVLHDSRVSQCVKLFPMFPKLIKQFEFALIPENAIHKEDGNIHGCCKFVNPVKFINNTNHNLFLKGSYHQSYKYFHHIRNTVRELLIPNSNDTATANNIISVQNRNDFKICVHSRRGDFKSDGLHEPTHPAFARLAVDFLVTKHKKSNEEVTVLLMSNDFHFSHAVFETHNKVVDVKQVSNETADYKQKLVITYPLNSPKYKALLISNTAPSVDLAISRAFCDVVLTTAPSSTFGWWLAYLSKPGSVVYYRNIEETEDKVTKEMNQEDFFLPHWIRLGTDSKGNIIER